MTDLRTAARQALEKLEQLQGGCTDSDDGTVEAITVWCPEVISDLRSALEPDAVERERSNEIRRLAIRALCAWDESVLPKSNDGMMQERMEDLRAALEKDDSVTAPPIWETLAEIGASAPAGTWDASPAEPSSAQPLRDCKETAMTDKQAREL